MSVLVPQDEAELAGILREAAGPLRIVGGGTQGLDGAEAGQVLSLAGIAGVTLYEPGAMTLVARAGTPLAEIEPRLAEAGQRLAFEPMDLRPLLGTTGAPTLGGMAASNLSGPRRIRVGACRDALLGARFVDGTGMAVKSGGRVMKNVTGLDLARLMVGARGSLGVLTELAFRVLPAPEAAVTVALDGLGPEQAVEALALALNSPWEVTGAAYAGGRTLVRLDGFRDAVSYRAGRIRALWSAHGTASVEEDPAAVAALWQGIRDVTAFAERPGEVWCVSVRPADGPGVAARAGGEALFDWGCGRVWLLVPEATDVRAAIAGVPGHATMIRGRPDAARPRLEPVSAPEAALLAGLRQRFDPRGILNPGLMGRAETAA